MKTPLREKAYQHIREKIFLRELTAGSRLEEVKIAKELGVSRAPVREALCRLESEGILYLVPRMGTFVKIHNRDEICDWWELRAVLEGSATEKVATQVSESGLEGIVAAHRKMLQLARKIRTKGLSDLRSPLAKEWERSDLGFHMAIVRAAGNQAMVKMVENLHIMDMFLDGPTEPIRSMVRRVCTEHGRILRAIRKGQPVIARKEMVSQLMWARQVVLSHMQQPRNIGFYT
tara:strand:- start:501 stop:1196 length:696 start_codon:yes stop_codon:yes gene_type:complete